MTCLSSREQTGATSEMAESPPSSSSRETSPQVSVIIPTYNRGHYIEESIRSVLTQSYADIEVIVVDDGSTDDTEKIIDAIVDSRLHYIRQENRGRSNARNHALSIAVGKYITFLDSDDVYLPNKIELQVAYLEGHPGVGMVYTSAYCINDAGDMMAHKYEATVSGHIYEQIAFFIPVTITLPTVMTFREVMNHVGGFDENMHRFEDTDMWRRISKTYRIDAMPEYTCKLRTHDDNSLLNQNPDQIVSALDYYAKKIIRDDGEVDMAVRKKGLACLYWYYGCALIRIPQFRGKGKELLRIAFGYDTWPNILRDWTKFFARIAYYRTLSKVKKIIKEILRLTR